MGRGKKKGKISAFRLKDCICKGDENGINAAKITFLTQLLWTLLVTLLKILCLTLRKALLFFSEHKTNFALCRPDSASSLCKNRNKKTQFVNLYCQIFMAVSDKSLTQ